MERIPTQAGPGGRFRAAGWSCVLLVLVCAIPGRAPAFAESRYEEAAVRAAMLINLPKFIVWPKASGGPAQVCVVGSQAVLQALSALHASARAAGRPSPLDASEGVGGDCRYVYLGDARRVPLEALPPDCLVIGQGEGAGDAAVELVRRGERVVIRLNHQRLRARGFNVDARLLQLAEIFDES